MELSWPHVFLLMLASLSLFSGAEMMGVYSVFAEMTQTSMDRINQVKEIPKMDDNPNGKTLAAHDISFEQVSLAYDTVPVLKDISFQVPEQTMRPLWGFPAAARAPLPT